MGFIRSHLAKRILSEGGRVATYDACLNFTNPEHSRYAEFLEMRKALLKDEVTFIEGDTRDRAMLEKTLPELRPSYIVHPAAVADAMKCRQYPDEASSSNVDGTRNVLSCLKDLDSVRRFVFFSSSFVYGNLKYNPADESHPRAPEHQQEPDEAWLQSSNRLGGRRRQIHSRVEKECIVCSMTHR